MKFISLLAIMQMSSLIIFCQTKNISLDNINYFKKANLGTLSSSVSLPEKGMNNNFGELTTTGNFTIAALLGSDVNTSDYYLKRSKRFNEAGLIFLSSGVLISASSLLFIPRKGNSIPSPDGLRTFFALVGTLPIIISVPFFISANHNKKIALGMNLKATSYNMNKLNNYSGIDFSVKLTF